MASVETRTFLTKEQVKKSTNLRNEIPQGTQEAVVHSEETGKLNESQKYTLLQAPVGTNEYATSVFMVFPIHLPLFFDNQKTGPLGLGTE